MVCDKNSVVSGWKFTPAQSILNRRVCSVCDIFHLWSWGVSGGPASHMGGLVREEAMVVYEAVLGEEEWRGFIASFKYQTFIWCKASCCEGDQYFMKFQGLQKSSLCLRPHISISTRVDLPQELVMVKNYYFSYHHTKTITSHIIVIKISSCKSTHCIKSYRPNL